MKENARARKAPSVRHSFNKADVNELLNARAFAENNVSGAFACDYNKLLMSLIEVKTLR